MARGAIVVPEYVINGSFGELIASDVSGNLPDTLFLGDVQGVEAKISKTKKELYFSGTRKTRHKLMAVSGEGTINKYKVTSDFFRIVSNVYWKGKAFNEGNGGTDVIDTSTVIAGSVVPAGRRTSGHPYVNIDYRCSLRVNLDDPESLGVEQVRLHGVKFWEIPFGFKVNETIEEAIQFTFEDIEFISAISGNALENQYATRYELQRNL